MAKGARLLNVPSALRLSLGSLAPWRRCGIADAREVISREAAWRGAHEDVLLRLRASLKAKAAETIAQLATLEDVDKVVAERRTVLYNQVVTSYHKAKIERAGLARELEAAKGGSSAARAQCAESEEAGRAAAAKLKVAEGELTRLRRLEDNHLKELAALKKAEEEKVEGLSKRLEEVDPAACTSPRAAFPEAQDAALAAVGKAREERRQATGEQSSACFTMEDYMASMAARVEPITKFGWELRKAAEELIRLLWPTETLPQDLANLIKWLETAPDRFLDWKESATRAGADMASPLCFPGTTRWTSAGVPAGRRGGKPSGGEQDRPACPRLRHRRLRRQAHLH
ncbi:hypothetical protein QYE76_010258 [Lolium multiflorum]|uniref:Uncharacterized protein n=1 Tax=Lolium multiflorum TaxID=4521 RepID=A0AAD8TTH5_LOLMU|nr:hypothetical protein QYE76_010258 [Lolium multiflorum]